MRTLVLLVIAALSLAPAIARADAQAASRADALKQDGLAAAQRKDWQLARAKFEQSYALDPRPLTLFNLAAAQENTEQLIAARKSYKTFLERSARGENEQFRAIAKTKIAELDQTIPKVRITVTGFVAGLTIQIDGRAISATELAAQIPVDPGEHAFAVIRGDQSVVRRTVEFARGGREDVELVVPPPVITEAPPPSPIVTTPDPVVPQRDDRSVLKSPWFWGITGAVVLGVAATAYVVSYGSPFEEDPTRGTLGRGVVEIP